MAISDDAQFLYAGLNGAQAIQRIILSTMTPDIQFSLGADPAWPKYAGDLKVLPGSSGSVAVSERYFGASDFLFAGLAIFDNGVERPNSILPNQQVNQSTRSISPQHLQFFMVTTMKIPSLAFLELRSTRLEFL